MSPLLFACILIISLNHGLNYKAGNSFHPGPNKIFTSEKLSSSKRDLKSRKGTSVSKIGGKKKDKPEGRVVKGKGAQISAHRFIVHIRIYGREVDGFEGSLDGFDYDEFSASIKIDMDPDEESGEHLVCAGSILSTNTVVTAAHCVEEDCRGVIRYGSTSAARGKIVKFQCLQNVKRHRSLDVAVITLPKGKKFEGEIFKPIKIATDTSMTPQPGQKAIVAGWGLFGDHQDEYPLHLQEAQIHVAENSNCSSTTADFKKGKEICAGDPKKGRDTCEGDSGGPLECFNEKNVKYLCGVTSRGSKLCGEDYAIYTSMTDQDMIAWLKKFGNAKTVGPRVGGSKSNGSKSPPMRFYVFLSSLALIVWSWKFRQGKMSLCEISLLLSCI